MGNITERLEFDEELYQKNLEEFDWDSVEVEDGRGDDLMVADKNELKVQSEGDDTVTGKGENVGENQ